MRETFKIWRGVLLSCGSIIAMTSALASCATVDSVATSVCAKKAEAEAVAKAAIEYMNEHCPVPGPTATPTS